MKFFIRKTQKNFQVKFMGFIVKETSIKNNLQAKMSMMTPSEKMEAFQRVRKHTWMDPHNFV